MRLRPVNIAPTRFSFMKIAWYTTSGTLQFSVDLGSPGNPGFFEGVGAGNFTFDPKCMYDDQQDRFVVVVLEVYGSTESWICLAVSDDSDEEGVADAEIPGETALERAQSGSDLSEYPEGSPSASTSIAAGLRGSSPKCTEREPTQWPMHP